MKRLFLILIGITTPVGAQTTTCDKLGNTTTCRTEPQSSQSGPNYQQLLNSGRDVGDAFARGREQALREQQMQLEIQRRQMEIDAMQRQQYAVPTPAPIPIPTPPLVPLARLGGEISMFSKQQFVQNLAALVARGDCPIALDILRSYGDAILLERFTTACRLIRP